MAQIILTKRNKPTIEHDGFLFVFEKLNVHGDIKFWRCQHFGDKDYKLGDFLGLRPNVRFDASSDFNPQPISARTSATFAMVHFDIFELYTSLN